MLPPTPLPCTRPPVRALFPYTAFRHTTLPLPPQSPPLPPSLPSLETLDPLPLVTATWRCFRPRQGELLLSRPLLPHFSSSNVPAVVVCNPTSKHRLCSHLLRNLVKLSAPLSPCNSNCLQHYYLCILGEGDVGRRGCFPVFSSSFLGHCMEQWWGVSLGRTAIGGHIT